MIQPVRTKRAKANDVDTTKWTYTLVLDMNNIMKISTVDHRIGSDGKEYGIVFKSLEIIGKVLSKKDFNFCIACYDGFGSGVLRYEYYKDYKANRDKHYELFNATTDYDKFIADYCKKVLSYSKAKKKPSEAFSRGETDDESFDRQKAVLQQILEELCIRQYEYEKVEGDDLISYYVHNKRDDEKVVIVSSDKDITQLISETVIVYNPREKDFITCDNSVEKLGITHKNIVTEKIFCGDASDNIKGIKGLGEQTLSKYFPKIRDEAVGVEEIVEEARRINEERAANKKKPLKVLENIVNKVCDGSQGDKVYEVNKKIIDLSEPMVTRECAESLSECLYAPLDMSDRSVSHVYEIAVRENMTDLMDDEKFSRVLAPYSRIIAMEGRYARANS